MWNPVKWRVGGGRILLPQPSWARVLPMASLGRTIPRPCACGARTTGHALSAAVNCPKRHCPCYPGNFRLKAPFNLTDDAPAL